MATYSLLAGTVTTDGQFKNEAAASSFTVAADAYVITTVDNTALQVEGAGVWTIKVDGGLWSNTGLDDDANGYVDGTGLSLYNFAATGNDKVSIGADGTVAGMDTGLFSSVAADIVNAGVVVGLQFGMDFFGKAGPGQDGSESNLNLTGKKVLIDNKAGADIYSDFMGINFNAFATLTLKNAGHIGGGYDSFIDANGDDEDDDGYTGSAFSSRGTTVLTNATTGKIDGNVEFGWINSKLDNSGKINGTVISYAPRDNADMVDLDRDGNFSDTGDGGAALIGDLVGVTITNKGTIFGYEEYGYNNQGTTGPGDDNDDQIFQVAIDLGRTKDTVTNSGKIFGDVWLNRGNDTLTNSGTIQGFVDGGRGNDVINNKGTIAYGLNSGEGDDVVTNSGTIFETINLGAGNDKYTGGKSEEIVNDDAGADLIALADGDDYMFVFGDDGFGDSFDGGKNFDTLDLFNSGGQSVAIDLAAKTMQFDGGTADTVLNFEYVIGTDQSDVIKGSAVAETLEGNGGTDDIYGRGGKDILSGGAAADRFIYDLASDSGKTRATRDVITDFEVGSDKICLLFDADTLVAGAQDFTVLLENTAFTKVAGQLRYVWQGAQTIIEGDTNADGKADFSIALNDNLNLDISDFVFNIV